GGTNVSSSAISLCAGDPEGLGIWALAPLLIVSISRTVRAAGPVIDRGYATCPLLYRRVETDKGRRGSDVRGARVIPRRRVATSGYHAADIWVARARPASTPRWHIGATSGHEQEGP